MESLFRLQERLLRNVEQTYVRDYFSTIDWNAKLSCLCGPKGVGKTTLMLQYIKSHYCSTPEKVLYASAENLYFARHTIVDLAENFVMMGGEHLFIDEIHKYPSWSREIKLIYDAFPELKMTFSGSSLLQILNPEADLSRRCIKYDIQGLSFREFLGLYRGINIPKFTLEDLLTRPHEVCSLVCSLCHPVPLFSEYLQVGYYPYYKSSPDHYQELVSSSVSYVLEAELPALCSVEAYNVRKLRVLLGILSSNVPFQTDMTKLSTAMQATRNTVGLYLSNLAKAKIIRLLYSDAKSLKKMQKPDKIYLDNPNLLYALSEETVNIGTARETFVANQLSQSHLVEYGKETGDFKVDRKYTFEVGGHAKGYSQIANIPNSYILADDLETPVGNKLPLWSVGLLY